MTAAISRRALIAAGLGAVSACVAGGPSLGQSSRMTFASWVQSFRTRARSRGISDATYNRVMGSIKPDTSVYALDRAQPEFREAVWQYLNRRVSDWRIMTGKALAGTARYLAERGGYRRGESWGCEVRLPAGVSASGARSMAAWHKLGVRRANGQPLPETGEQARLWRPAPGGPTLLLARNFDAVKSYNPANTYALAIAHLGDRIRGDGPFVQPYPGGERTPTLAEVQEIQRRLTALGFDTGGTDGRVGRDTMVAVRDYQRKVGMTPADGYAGLKLLARLRRGT